MFLLRIMLVFLANTCFVEQVLYHLLSLCDALALKFFKSLVDFCSESFHSWSFLCRETFNYYFKSIVCSRSFVMLRLLKLNVVHLRMLAEENVVYSHLRMQYVSIYQVKRE